MRDGRIRTIGIIDDDDAVRDSLHALLDSYGYDIQEYTSAENFLASSERRSHCLIVDQHMPGMSGLDLLEQLRCAGNMIPAFLITGRDDRPLRRHADRLGIEVHNKPLAEDALVAAVARALQA